MFTPSGKYVVKGGKNAQEVAKLFAADYHDLVGKPLTPKTGKPSAGDIVLVLQSDKKSARLLGKEGYRLTIGDVTTITASSVEGLVWGTRTVLQLSEQQRSAGFVLPKGSRPGYACLWAARLHDGLRQKVHPDVLSALAGQDDVLLTR